VADKGKGKITILGDPGTSDISQGGIAQKVSDKKTNKSGGAGGVGSSIAGCPAPACGQSNGHTDGLANPAGQSTHGQRRRPPHKAKKEMQGQSICNTHGRLVKVIPTFDQSLSKYSSKKAVLRDWPTKKPQSPSKTKRSNKMGRNAAQQASRIHPSLVMPSYFPPTYST
jgi:hypothetical protein